jgi:hypothetical protein
MQSRRHCRPCPARPPDRAEPAHRGHDLRLVRQPRRALPARPTAWSRPTSTWPPSRRRCASTRPSSAATSWCARSSGGLRRPRRAAEGGRPGGARREAEPRWPPSARARRGLGIQAVFSLAVGLGMMALMLWPTPLLPMEQLNLLFIVPATLVQFWAGRRFYVAAWRAARHGSANMSTLVVLGTSAAWGYSTVVAFWPQPGDGAGIEPMTYYDTSAVIIGLVLAGRWLEARAKAQTAGAVAGWPACRPRPRGSCATGRERRRAAGRRPAGRPAARPAGREGARRRARRRRLVGGRRVDADRRIDARRQGPGDEVIGATVNTSGSFLFRATRVGRDTVLAQIVRWCRRRRARRRPSSAWPTRSPAGSCRSCWSSPDHIRHLDAVRARAAADLRAGQRSSPC